MHDLEIVARPHVPAAGRRRFRLSPRARRWMAGAGFVLLASVMAGIWLVGRNWPFRYRSIHPLLEDVFGSQVSITQYRRTYFPHPGFMAMGLALRRNTAPDQPPIGTVRTLFVQARWIDLLQLRDQVQLVSISGAHFVLPAPGSRAAQEDFPPGSSSDFAGPQTPIAHLEVHDSQLDVLRADGSFFSFPVRLLQLRHLQLGRAMQFAVDMDNAVPRGRIHASGSFGPLNTSAAGDTPLSGTFTFDRVDLAEVGKLHGTLSSSGRFSGRLDAISAQAQAEIPGFAVSDGHGVPVAGSVECTVNGLNGDVFYRRLEVHTGATVVEANGSTAGTPRKSTRLAIAVRQGRVEELLRPFLSGPVPVAGPVSLHGRAYLAPAKPGHRFLERLRLEGAFDIPSEGLTDASMRQKLAEFSQRAQDKKVPDPAQGEQQAGASDPVSSLEGLASIENGIVPTRDLKFQVSGARAQLSGDFNLETTAVHLTGRLSTREELSGLTTGFKSFLLLPLDPFFRKGRRGAVISIAVTGTRGHYQVTQNLMHSK